LVVQLLLLGHTALWAGKGYVSGVIGQMISWGPTPSDTHHSRTEDGKGEFNITINKHIDTYNKRIFYCCCKCKTHAPINQS